MAGEKISVLPPIVAPALTDIFPVSQGGVTYKETPAQLFTLFTTLGGAALTEVNDTNVTLTLGGSPTTALLNATSLTLGWTGSLAVSRGGTGDTTFTAYSVICAGTTATGAFQNVAGLGTSGQVLTSNGAGALPTWQATGIPTGAALTEVNDTNVTLTLGGSPNIALLNAASITAGWTGQLSLTRGGTNASLTASNGGMVYSNGTALAILAGTATAGQIIRSGASTTPTWSTATYPATAGTSGNVLTSDGTNWNSTAPSASATSVITNDTTTNATVYPLWVTATSGSLPLKVSSTKLSFNPLGSTLTLAGNLAGCSGITDTSSNYCVLFGYDPAAVNYIVINNNVTTSPPQIGVGGSDATIGLSLITKKSSINLFDDTATISIPVRFYNAAGNQYTALQGTASQSSSVTFTLPVADGTNGQILQTNGSGVLSFVSASAGSGTVNSGTAGQLAYYATSGAAVSSLSAVTYPVATGWTPYTPTISLVGGSGNVVPTFSSTTARYSQIGNTIFVDMLLANSSGGTAGAGSGQVNISLPVTPGVTQAQGNQLCGILINGVMASILSIQILTGGATTAQIGFFTGTTFQGAEGATF